MLKIDSIRPMSGSAPTMRISWKSVQNCDLYRNFLVYIYIYTGWCILSRNAAIPHMVCLGYTPLYYLHVILLTCNILRHTSEIICTNKLGKMCDVMRMASRIVKKQSFVVRQYSVKNSCKFIKTIPTMSLINMFNQQVQNWQKNLAFLGIFSIWFMVKKVIAY